MTNFAVQLFCNESFSDVDGQPSRCELVSLEIQNTAPSRVTREAAEEEVRRLRLTEQAFRHRLKGNVLPVRVEDRRWLVGTICQISTAASFSFETKVRAVSYMDIHLLSDNFKVQELPKPIVLAVTYVCLAAKMEEVKFETYCIRDLISQIMPTTSYGEVAQTERLILKAMDWKLTGCTVGEVLPPLAYMLEPALPSIAATCPSSQDLLQPILDTASCLCLQALSDYRLATQRPSQLALAAILVAVETLLVNLCADHFPGIQGCAARVIETATDLLKPSEISFVCEIQDLLYAMLCPSAPAESIQSAAAPACDCWPESPRKRTCQSLFSPKSVLAGQTSDSDSSSEFDSPTSMQHIPVERW